MCPEKYKHRINNQRGFLVPLAAIIVVGIAVLALAIARISGQASAGNVQEGLSVQAYFAADSAAQYAMNQLFFNVTSKTVADANCVSLSGSSLNFSVTGLALCSSNLTCSSSIISGSTVNYYLITSAASCGSGDTLAERIIAVSAYME